MKKLGFPAIMLLLTGVIGVGVWSYFYSPFPVRIRRLVQASYQQEGTGSDKAARALRRMGSRATPALLKLMRHKNSQVRRAAIQGLVQIQISEGRILKALQRALRDENWRVRRAAAQTLGKRRWRAAPATNALAATLSKEKEWLVRKELVDALGLIGPFAKAATPTLLNTLKDKEWIVRRGALIALARVGLPLDKALKAYPALLRDPQWRVRERAALQLGRFQERAMPAFHTLVRAAHDSHARVQAGAVKALQKIGPATLKRALRAATSWQRVAAARALGMLGSKAASAVSALTSAAGDSHANVRKAALETLSQVGPKGMNAFLSLLGHANPKMRALAAQQLRALSSFAVVTAPALHRLLQDDNRNVRWAAAQAIAHLPPTLPTLRTLLSHNKSWVRRKAVSTLAKLGPQAVLILLEALSNQDRQVRALAAAALGQMQTHQALIIRDLNVALKDKADMVKLAAAKALSQHGSAGRKVYRKYLQQANEREFLLLLESITLFGALDAKTQEALMLRLRRALGSSVDSNKATAARILGSQGKAAAAAGPLLNTLLKDKSSAVRQAAASALGEIGPKAALAVARLQENVSKYQGQERLISLRSLVRLGSNTPAAIHALRKLLRHNDSTLRRLSAQALQELGPKALPALPDLMWALGDSRVRSTAAAAIGAIGAVATPSLLPLLRHQKQWVRWTVIEILATFGKGAKSAEPALHKALHDPITAVRIAAARALTQIAPQADAAPTAPRKTPTPGSKPAKPVKPAKLPAKPVKPTKQPAKPIKQPAKQPTKPAPVRPTPRR